MGLFFRNLWASFVIFHSNFNAKYGKIVNDFVLLVILALVLYALVRAVLAGQKTRRSFSPMKTRVPDQALTRHAAESLSQALRIPSVTGQKKALQEMAEYLQKRYPAAMKAMSCAVRTDGSMLLRWKAATPTDVLPVLLCGHLDVVPGGDGWKVCEPFDGLRQSGKIYGRGAVDCKSVIIALMEAVETLATEGYTPKRDVYLAFSCDEETGGYAGAKTIAQTMEKQGLKFDLILDEGGTFEDSDLGEGRTYAAAMIGMGEKRQCNYLVTANCKSCHSSRPSRPTALGVLSEAICRVERAQPHHHMIPLVRNHLDAAISTFSFGKRFAVANKPLFGLLVSWVFRGDPSVLALVRTTIVPTRMDGSFPAANMLPATTSVMLNARLLPNDTPEGVLQDVRNLLSDLPVSVEMCSEGEESFITSEKQPMYQLLCGTIQETYPSLPCIPTLMTSSGDARHYSNLSDCILRFAPLVTGKEAGGGGHQPDEFIAEQSLGLAAELYINLLRKL